MPATLKTRSCSGRIVKALHGCPLFSLLTLQQSEHDAHRAFTSHALLTTAAVLIFANLVTATLGIAIVIALAATVRIQRSKDGLCI